MQRFSKFLLLFAVLFCFSSRAASTNFVVNGKTNTLWNGKAITAWNGKTNVFVASGGGGSGYASGLGGLWHLDEGSGASRADSVNSTTLANNGTVGSGTGQLGNAATFPTANSANYLSAAANANINTTSGSWTVGIWFNLSDTAANHGIISKGAQDAYEEYSIIYNAGGDQCRAFMRDLATQVASPKTFTATGVWHLAVIWYDSVAQTFNIQVDNESPYGTTTGVTSGNTTFTGTLKLGRANGTQWMEGSLDNPYFYPTKALSDAERTAIWNGGAGLAGP